MCRSPLAYGGPSCRLNFSPGAESRSVSYTRCFAHHACADGAAQCSYAGAAAHGKHAAKLHGEVQHRGQRASRWTSVRVSRALACGAPARLLRSDAVRCKSGGSD